MSTRAHQIKHLFQTAVELPLEAREQFLQDQCGDDPALREAVSELLKLDGGFCDRFMAGESDQKTIDSPSAREHPPGLPRRIGRYEILARIGEGGMGVVYEARQDNPHRIVAVKVLRSGIASASLLRRFQQEADVLGQLQHPGIAQIFEAGIGDGDEHPYIAMELIRGEPLLEYADRRNLGTRARMALLARICDAVQHAHERGVIHRDLKPGNILVVEHPAGAGSESQVSEWSASRREATESGNRVPQPAVPKILDFGVARITDSDIQAASLCTGVGQLIGTIPYMSPEQAGGDAAHVDRRADIYALGVILYELLSGKLPVNVHGKSIPEAVRLVREQEPSRLSSISPMFRGDVETIVSKCIEKDKTRRYQSAADLAADIRRYLRDEPIVARPASAVYQLRKFARRNKVLVGGVASTMVVLFAGIIFTTWFALREAEQRRAANLNEMSAQRANYASCVSTAAIALENHDVSRARLSLESAPESLRGWEWRHFWSRLDQCDRLIRFEMRDACLARFTDQGDAVEVIPYHGPSPVQVWSAATGDRLPDLARDAAWLSFYRSPAGPDNWNREAGALADVRIPIATGDRFAGVVGGANGPPPDVMVRSPCLSVDSSVLAFVTLDKAVSHLWTIRTGESPEVRFLSDAPVGPCIAISPDGGRLLVSTADGGNDVLDTRTGTVLARLLGHTDRVMAAQFSPDGRRIVTGSWDNSVRTWDAESGRPLEVGRGHTDHVETVAYSPDGFTVASAGRDSLVRIWNAATLDPQAAWQGHEGRVLSVSFSHDGAKLVSAGADGTARLWNTAQRDPDVLRGHASYVYPIAVSPDGKRIASAGWDNTIRMWDADSRQPLGVIQGHAAPTYQVGFSPDGRRLATASADRTMRVWDAGTLRQIALLEDPDSWVTPIAFTADNAKLLLHWEGESAPRLWNVATGAVTTDAPSALHHVRSSDISPNGRYALARQRGVKLIDLETGDNMLVAEVLGSGDTLGYSWAAFSPDSSRVVVLQPDLTLAVFDLATRRKIGILRGHTQTILAVAWSHDGRRIATAGREQAIRIWDAQSLTQVAELRGHTSYVWSLGWSPDGTYLVSGSGDHTVRIWDSISARERMTKGKAR